MTKADEGPILAGVDGCREGWIAVLRRPGSSRTSIHLVPRLAELIDGLDAPVVIAIDMPIGLPDRIGPGGRGPEAALRPLLGARQSSVFSVPPRAAVYAEDYRDACTASLAASDPPRKVSKQCFFLFPKIREVDGLLRRRPELIGRLVESHPEGAFMRMKAGPLAEPKKVKSQPHGPGLAERRALLAAEGFGADVLETTPPRGAGADDLLDACACWVTASRLFAGTARPFPANPARDAFGIPIAIWA